MLDGWPYAIDCGVSLDDPLPEYDYLLFSQVWENAPDFVADYLETQLPEHLSQPAATWIFYLLYARYGNAPISFLDVNQFKYAMFSKIFQYGHNWLKKLDVQQKIRNLTDEEIMAGGKSISNYAVHPDTEPSAGTLDELQSISQQTSVNRKRGKMEGYERIMEILDDDYTDIFLERFRPLFLKILSPYRTAIYPNKKEE